jgi:hypothetical protein
MTLPLKKVISGGQTGADQAGVIAARLCGLKTGGTMPAGFRTLDGPNPAFAQEYGLTESISPGYHARTLQNVCDADGTIRFARDFSSPGEKLTLQAIKMHGKPKIDVHMDNPIPPSEVRDWIIGNNIRILNVAGNSEKTAPGIAKFVGEYMIDVLEGA